MLDQFLSTLITVTALLLIAAPGYLMIKFKMLSNDCISGFSKVLLYVCQPCLAIYSFSTIEFSAKKIIELGIFALLTLGVMTLMLVGTYLVLRRRQKQPIYRIMTIATTFANCAFFGIPIIRSVMGEAADGLIVYTTVFALVMNIIGWTVGAAIISRNMNYISVKKIFLNPATLGVCAALVFFIFSIPIEPNIGNMISVTGNMCTPLSMLIMGMRLGTMELKSLFTNVRVYITVAVKMIVMPLLAFAFVYFLPLSSEVKMTFYIISACPTASVVLNFAEIVGDGQKEAAAMVLTCTILSVAIMPVMMLLLPLL